MLKFLIVLFYLIYTVYGTGEFIILEHPKTLHFSNSKDVIDGRDIPNVFAASLGFTLHESSNWQGLTIKSPFGFADVVAVVAVNGIPSLGDFGKVPVYPVNPVEDEQTSWRMLQDDVLEHFPLLDNQTLLRVELGSVVGNDLDDVSVESLDKSLEEDDSFLQELKELESYVQGYERNGVSGLDAPVVNWFTFSGLHYLSDIRGADHVATVEAKSMLRETLLKMGRVLREKSNGRALVAVIVSDGSHTRHVRAADGQNDTSIPDNRATVYSESYPAIFNIILWFAVAFIFSLIAISYFIGTMDPGRDSIIYRMTSNRMKKDS